MGKLFGTDGIRGEANRYPMDAETALALGRAVTHLHKRNGRKPRLIIGKDTRLSGYMLESSLEAGVTSMGGIAYLVGVLPTPGIAFVTRSMRADAGFVISASHNPYRDNGIKIFSGRGFKLTDTEENLIEELIFSGRLNDLVPAAKDMGHAYRMYDVHGRYIVFLKNTLPRDLSIEGVKIVVDTANGASYRVAEEVFTELGADLEVIHNKPNGLNINDKCGSQHTMDLRRRVVETGAAVGLALDGDGDRLIAVDEKGREIDGDQLMFIFAKALKEAGRLTNDLVVTTVMSNIGFHRACRRHGIRCHAANVGDRYVLEDMLRLDAVLGGEQAGHIIFREHHTTGDGILAALQLLTVMVETGRPLSELAAMMEIYPQRLINVKVKEKPDLATVPAVAAAVREAEMALGEEGRVLVRYSGTENLCRVMVEGPDEDITARLSTMIAAAVAKALA